MKTGIHSEISRVAYKMLGYGNNISYNDFIELKQTIAKLQEQIVITIDQKEREHKTDTTESTSLVIQQNTMYNAVLPQDVNTTPTSLKSPNIHNNTYTNSNELFEPKQNGYQSINQNYNTTENNLYNQTTQQNNINIQNKNNNNPKSLNHKLKSRVNNIGLNDKILLTNKLFKGDVNIYHETINNLQSIQNTQDRINYLERNIKSQNATAWNKNQKEAKRFVDLFVA